MTTLFISHGAPTLALEPGATGLALKALASRLPRPSAILVVSAHWDSQFSTVSGALQPSTIHDFGGFPDALYQMQYPALGAPALADRAMDLLHQADVQVNLDEYRGLDHGAWVPLQVMYPEADIPVTQLSIQSHKGATKHYQMGKALSQLQAEGVMILCSGALTHNLNDFTTMQRDAPALEYVSRFSNWIAEKIAAQDTEALLRYRSESQDGQRAHPTEDHLLPLFVALGAGQGAAKRYQPETTFGILAMDIYCWE